MTTTVSAPPGALELYEAIEAKPTPLAEDGTTLIHVIRPGQGYGRGNHYYPSAMLQENADRFAGWRVYIDHLSPAAKQALGGLPRSMRDLGGMIEESWWDDTVPANDRHPEPGAVVAKLRPIRELREVVEQLPQAVEFSIRAKATDVSGPELKEGRESWIVEGIRPTGGSVDAVTEAGAGGKIAEIIEGLDRTRVLQESREVVEEAVLTGKARKQLPQGSFAIPEKRAYPIHDEAHARNALTRVAQHGSDEEKKRVRAAVKRRYPKINVQEAHDDDVDNADEGGDEVAQLEEALRDPDSRVSRALSDIIKAQVEERLSKDREEHGKELEEAKREATAEASRQISLRDLRQEAHVLIQEAKLPEPLSKRLRSEYDLQGDSPRPKLDLRDEEDEDGQTTKTAQEQLQESVRADIEEQRKLLAEVNPTRVEDQGPSHEDGDTTTATTTEEKPYFEEFLEEAGIDPGEAFGDKDNQKPKENV
jgi:hypothetical protein